jgi:hypothetical protein
LFFNNFKQTRKVGVMMEKQNELLRNEEYSPVILSDACLYGQGSHKKCYQVPGRKGICIKIPYNDGGVKDLAREIRYIHVMRHQHKDSTLLPRYYGPVRTNYGMGHAFEMIIDAEGTTCHTLEEFLQHPESLQSYFEPITELLRQMKKELIDKEIITMGLYPENILFQHLSDGTYKVRLVNDMGSKTWIPLEYFSKYFAHRRVVERWKEFLKTIMRKYPSSQAEALIKKIA